MSEMTDFSSALQRAFDLGDKAATAQYEAQNRPNIIEHDGAAYLYFNGKLTQIEPAEIYHPETFYASTLEGLCDYIQADSDEQFVTGQPAPLVVVESPVRVNVYLGKFLSIQHCWRLPPHFAIVSNTKATLKWSRFCCYSGSFSSDSPSEIGCLKVKGPRL